MNKRSYGTLVVTIGVLLPAIFWLTVKGFTIELNTLGRIAGLMGLAALSINIILSARLKIFDGLFHGLDKMYRLHHTLGCVTVILVLVHFNLMVIRAAQFSLDAGYDLLFDFTSWYRVTAKIGLLLLVSGIIITLYFKVKYRWFILMQRIMGAAIFFGGYHAFFVPGSEVAKQPILFAYMLSLGGMAVAVYLYRSIFHKPLNKAFTYKITRVNLLGKVTEIYMKPVNRTLQHYAGQYAFISFHSKLVPDEIHPFSISSGSESPELRFSVKQLGDFTNTLPKLKAGDTVSIEGPFGYFTPTKITSKHQVWIAGGIGVTPFLSMAQSIDKSLSVDLYYCSLNKDDAIYLEELMKSAHNKNIRVYSVLEDVHGFLKASQIKSITKHTQILICGPSSMMKSMSTQFIDMGIKKESIHFEEFALS